MDIVGAKLRYERSEKEWLMYLIDKGHLQVLMLMP